ncbi:hypothetical protein C8R44DRAFT_887207 [Mycena epipterygia]|nr:hypothetical protein C8R44DRAFT_887207 [Mycena epipterygia]
MHWPKRPYPSSNPSSKCAQSARSTQVSAYAPLKAPLSSVQHPLQNAPKAPAARKSPLTHHSKLPLSSVQRPTPSSKRAQYAARKSPLAHRKTTTPSASSFPPLLCKTRAPPPSLVADLDALSIVPPPFPRVF